MKQGWEYKKLGDLSSAKLSYGSGASAIEYDGKVRYVRITDINEDGTLNEDFKSPSEFNEKYILNEGDLLFARSGATVGKTYMHNLINGNCIYAGYLIRFIPNKKLVFPPFVRYYTKSTVYKHFVENAQNAVAQPNINAQQYGNLLIPVPPLSTQQSIVSELDTLSQIIADYKEQLADYDKLEQSIFYDMFGDPVKNEKGWEVKKMGEVCDSIVRGPFGSALKKEFFVQKSEVTYKVYEQKHAIQKDHTIGSYYITQEKFKELKRFEVKSGDIIMSCSGTIGELYQIPTDAEKGVMNQALLKFHLANNIEVPFFLFLMPILKDSMSIHGCGLQNIGSVKIIKDLEFGLPDITLQKSFLTQISAIEQMKADTKAALQDAELLFQSRMDYWFNA